MDTDTRSETRQPFCIEDSSSAIKNGVTVFRSLKSLFTEGSSVTDPRILEIEQHLDTTLEAINAMLSDETPENADAAKKSLKDFKSLTKSSGIGVHYTRRVQQIVNALEQHPDVARAIEGITAQQQPIEVALEDEQPSVTSCNEEEREKVFSRIQDIFTRTFSSFIVMFNSRTPDSVRKFKETLKDATSEFEALEETTSKNTLKDPQLALLVKRTKWLLTEFMESDEVNHFCNKIIDKEGKAAAQRTLKINPKKIFGKNVRDHQYPAIIIDTFNRGNAERAYFMVDSLIELDEATRTQHSDVIVKTLRTEKEQSSSQGCAHRFAKSVNGALHTRDDRHRKICQHIENNKDTTNELVV